MAYCLLLNSEINLDAGLAKMVHPVTRYSRVRVK
jgi:hypothetical protein